jgi:hypothetical protein
LSFRQKVMNMADVRFSCPSCRARLEVPASLPLGRLVECPRCRETFRRSGSARATPVEDAEEGAAPDERRVGPAPVVKIVGAVLVAGVAAAAIAVAVLAAMDFQTPTDKGPEQSPAPGRANPKIMIPKMPMGNFKGMPPMIKKGRPKAVPPAEDKTSQLPSGARSDQASATISVSATHQRGFAFPMPKNSACWKG